MPVHHRIYGLHLESNIPVPGLPVCLDPLGPDVRVHLKQSPSRPALCFSEVPHFFYGSQCDEMNVTPALRVGFLPSGDYLFQYADGARFVVARDGREIWTDWPTEYALTDAATYLVGPIMGFALRLHGIVPLHASSVAIGGRAIALLGEAGAGKSTTSAAFAQLGFAVLADDLSALNEVGSRFLVEPGYPRVNLWPDSAHALFGSQNRLPAITPNWEKQFLALGRDSHRFQAQPLPLGAIFLLNGRNAGASIVKIEEIQATSALIKVVANTYVNYVLDERMRTQEFVVLSRLLAHVPVFQVLSPDDPTRIYELCEAIASAMPNDFAGKTGIHVAAKP